MIVTGESRLISCQHCGLIALDTPAFGWRRWLEKEESTFGDAGGEITVSEMYLHHCPAAVEYQDAIRGYLVHMKHPDEAVIYEDPERWVLDSVGAHDD